MADTPYVAYIDLLGIGDSSQESAEEYHDQLMRFRAALCSAVDNDLKSRDRVFAFSDCAYACSTSLTRLGNFLSRLQGELWWHKIFLKGAIAAGQLEFRPFADLPEQSEGLLKQRRERLHGHWFGSEFVRPALLEKQLKGIAIQIHSSITDEKWKEKFAVTSCYFPTEASRKPIPISNLAVRPEHHEALQDILRTFLLLSHRSRKISRYYVPLIASWIRSYDYSKAKCDERTGEWINAPLPLRQLVLNSRVASEISSHIGGDIIYYTLLREVAEKCEAAKIIEQVKRTISTNSRLRASAEHIPEEVCPMEIRTQMIDNRVRSLFGEIY